MLLNLLLWVAVLFALFGSSLGFDLGSLLPL